MLILTNLEGSYMMKKKFCIHYFGFVSFPEKITTHYGVKVFLLISMLLFTTFFQSYSNDEAGFSKGYLQMKERINSEGLGLEVFVPSVAFKKFSSLNSIGMKELEEIKSYVGSVAHYNTPHCWSLGDYRQGRVDRAGYIVTPLQFKNFTIFMVEKYHMTTGQTVWYVCYDLVVYNHPSSTLYYAETIESCKVNEEFLGIGYPETVVTGLYSYPSEAPETSPPPAGDVLYPQYVFKCDSQRGIFEIVENEEKQYSLENDLKSTWGWWYGYVNDYNVRVRNSPSLKGEILGVTDKYVEVQVRERSPEPEIIDGESWYWYKVHEETFSGWMYGKYLDKIDLYL